MGGVVDVVKAGAEPLSKLIDVVSRGIGILYEPTKIRKLAKAKAFEMSTIAQAIRDNPDLPMFYDRDGVKIDSSDVKALAERASSRLLLQEMRKQQNIEAIVDKAYVELQKETEVSSEPVDDDWIVRFFNSVEDVSNEKLQEIWARILAGEIKKPRSSSMRTLDLLKNMSVEEATVFEKVSVCVLDSGVEKYIPDERELWKEYGIDFRDLFLLCDAGLLNLSELSMNFEFNSTRHKIFNNEVVCILAPIPDTSPKPKKIAVRCLTGAGAELLEAVKAGSDQEREFALKYFKKLKLENEDLFISAYDLVSVSGCNFHHGSEDLLS